VPCTLTRRAARGIREAEGNGEEADVTGSGTEIRHDATYRHAALVIVDLDAHANATPWRPDIEADERGHLRVPAHCALGAMA